MRRDMDLIRDLLIWIDDDPQMNGSLYSRPDTPEECGTVGHSMDEIYYHLELLINEGMMTGTVSNDGPSVSKLTWKGHDFVDNIRDAGIWKKTKERIAGLPSVALTVVAAIAEAEIKKILGL